MKKFYVAIGVLILLALGSVGGIVFARSTVISTTTFFACEATASGVVDPATITQNNALTCPVGSMVVQWSVTGPQGMPGPTGATGAVGTTGAAGPAGVGFVHAACAETGLVGSGQQENMLFCQSGVEPDGGMVYQSAIQMANMTHRIAGTPIAVFPSEDWSGVPITYVEFTSGLHVEFHSDNIMRWYSWTSGRLF